MKATAKDREIHRREISLNRSIGCGTNHEGKVATCKACQKKIRARAKKQCEGRA